MKKVKSALAVQSTNALGFVSARLIKAEELFKGALTNVSSALSEKLTPEETAEVFGQVKTFGKLLEQVEKIAKAKTVELLKSVAEEVGEKGTLQYTTKTGVVLEARGSGGGYNAKLVEALLRAKELAPAKYMDQKITYTLNETKMQYGIDKKHFTQDELDTCKNERTYAVQSPKQTEAQE